MTSSSGGGAVRISALAWGARGRGFKSRSPDCFKFYDSVIRDFEGYHVAEGLIHLDAI